MDTSDILAIVFAGVFVLLVAFALSLFLFLRKENKKNGVFGDTFVISLLTLADILPWYKRSGGKQFCLCTAEKYNELRLKGVSRLNVAALVQFALDGEEVVAVRLVKYDEMDSSLKEMLEKGDGILVLDGKEGGNV